MAAHAVLAAAWAAGPVSYTPWPQLMPHPVVWPMAWPWLLPAPLPSMASRGGVADKAAPATLERRVTKAEKAKQIREAREKIDAKNAEIADLEEKLKPLEQPGALQQGDGKVKREAKTKLEDSLGVARNALAELKAALETAEKLDVDKEPKTTPPKPDWDPSTQVNL